MAVKPSGCEICLVLSADEPRVFVTDYWSVTLAADQGYLGRAYVSARRHVASLSELSTDEWTDLYEVISRYEAAALKAFGAVLFNWGCLMNNAFKLPDPKPHVHWHVRPRYDKEVTVAGSTYHDPNFAHHYDRGHNHIESESQIRQLTELLKDSLHAD